MTSPDPPSTAASTAEAPVWFGLAGAIACIAIVAVSGTLTYPLISLLLERAGESGARIGLNTAMASLGIIGFALIGHRPLAALGLTPFLYLCLAMLALSCLIFPLTENFWVWCAARLLLGAATAGLFLGSEYWVVAAAPDPVRGRVVAAYAFALSAGYALGPLTLLGVGVDGWAPFAVAASMAALAALPLSLARRAAPRVARKAGGPALDYFRSDPMLLWAVVAFGALEFGAMALAPVWAVRSGLPEATGIQFALSIALGGLSFQPLLGWAADRYPPRPLLAGSALACVAVAAVLPALDGFVALIYAVLFIWGGLAAALYTVALTAIGSRYSGAALASANGAMVAGYGFGALVGPLLVGYALDALGPNGFSAAIAAASTAYLALAASRMRATR